MSLNQLRTNLVYYDTVTLDPQINALGVANTYHQFRANSLYDPDLSGIGHQPMFHDNYSQLYQKYRVISSKIKVKILETKFGGVIPDDVGTGHTDVPSMAYRLMLCKDEGTDFPNDMRNAIEEKGSNVKWRYVMPNTLGRPQGLTMTCKIAKLLRCSPNDLELAGATGGSGTGGNPQREAIFTIGITGIDGVVNPPAVTLGIHIEYRVEYYDRQLVQLQN
jgi:hypothetical protein